MIKNLYEYREMVRSLIKRDLKGRYKNSALGFLWTFLNPLFQLIIYTFVFSVILPMNIEKYYIHLFVALVPWIFTSSCMTGGARVIIDQQDMVKKIYFPREILPISFTTSQFVNMLLSMLVILAVVLVSGHGVNFLALLYLPLVMAVHYLFCLGIVMICSAITVYLRDMEMILGVISFAWMYLTPVIYSDSMVPDRYRSLYFLNPMTPIIVAYRKILYYKEGPEVMQLLQVGVVGIAGVLAGIIIFKKLQRRFVEEL